MDIEFNDTNHQKLPIPGKDNTYYDLEDDFGSEKARRDITRSNQEHGLITGVKSQKPKSPIDVLRDGALTLSPEHGDKLYPLEVLGAYKTVYQNPYEWYFELGNAETWIDSQIAEWLNTCDLNKFRNRLERQLSQDSVIKELFLLRMNYSLLLEEGKDVIEVRTNPTRDMNFYNDNLNAVDLSKDVKALDKIADSFYGSVNTMSSVDVGTPRKLREIIAESLFQFGYETSHNLDEVYNKLNLLSKQYLESGLIARIGYLAFKAEIEGIQNNKMLE